MSFACLSIHKSCISLSVCSVSVFFLVACELKLYVHRTNSKKKKIYECANTELPRQEIIIMWLQGSNLDMIKAL